MDIPDLDQAIFVTTEGECSVSFIRGGVYVRTPWVVPQQPMGQPFQLHADMVKQMARALDLIDESIVRDEMNALKATIEEKDAAYKDLSEEADNLRYAANRFYASQSGKAALQTRSKNETKIEALENALAERDVTIEKLKNKEKVAA